LNTRLFSDPVLLLCTLAEEIGHHFTGVQSDILDNNRSLKSLIQIASDELKARIWATDFLVPDKEFQELIKDYKLTNEKLAKYLKVTETFIELKWQLL